MEARIHRIAGRGDLEEIARILRRPQIGREILGRVEAIVEEVRRGGDRALLRYVEELDGARIGAEDLVAEREDLGKIGSRAPEKLVKQLESLRRRVEAVEEPLVKNLSSLPRIDAGRGVLVENVLEPLERAACYIPGGARPYISTAIMCGTAARVAGVKRLSAAVPPRALGPEMAAALHTAGFERAYRAGGAHAIAALAYGTESIERVDKIAGPGGVYATAAKALVSRHVGIDFLAGPTELLLYLDRPGWAGAAALHLAAQAEHGDSVLLILVTVGEDLALQALKAFEELVGSGWRGILDLVVARDPGEAVELINILAPEHVEICSSSEDLADLVKSYGVLIDGCASAAVNDYYSGANHVLPTMGWARWRGGLSALDFLALRRRVRFRGSPADLLAIASEVGEITLSEGFPTHLRSIAGAGRG